MGAAKRFLKLIAICGVLCVCTTASHTGHAGEAKDTASGEAASLTMEITKLDVNDSTVVLTFNIKNGIDREVWICNSIGASRPSEIFLTHDTQTLLIRKRLDIYGPIWDRGAPVGTYVRIAPGGSFSDSIQLVLPVSPVFVFAAGGSTSVELVVRHLALEIGYYDGDLPALIHSIVAVADRSGLTVKDIPPNILDTYFKGIRTRTALWNFDVRNPDPYGQGRVSIDYSYQALTGEKILRADVNDVSIPYKGPVEG